MNWLTSFLVSSIGRKLIMSLTGFFLILFLLVHLAGNLQLLKGDAGLAFNKYTEFMEHNPFIQFIAYGLYFFIVIHTIQGILLARQNRKARGSDKYKGGTAVKASWASKNMILLGILIFAFLMLHMGDFWYKLKFTDSVAATTYPGLDHPIVDLYTQVKISFAELWIVICYVIGCIALAFHLWHGFASAFQTLGWRHVKYTPIIEGLGKIYSVLIPLGFAIIPIYFYLTINS